MEPAENKSDVSLEILRVLKEINAKLDVKKQAAHGHNEGSKPAQLGSVVSESADDRDDIAAAVQEQGSSVHDDGRDANATHREVNAKIPLDISKALAVQAARTRNL